MDQTLVKTEVAVLVLLLVACLATVSLRHVKLPFTVLLLIIGFGMGFLEDLGIPVVHLVISPELILFIFIPPLIFGSASRMDSRLLFRNLAPILTLAVPGLVLSILIVGGLLVWLTPLTLGQVLLFGALISATDPIAVVALFEQLGVPKRLQILVDGESMLNDATAIVAFGVIMSIISSGVWDVGAMEAALVKFVLVLLGGVAVGFVSGYVLRFFIRMVRENGSLIFSLSVIAAYFCFIIAQHWLEVSGVIAVMTAGLITGRYNLDHVKTEINKQTYSFWEYTAFVTNSLIFLLVGITTARFIIEPHAYTPAVIVTSVLWALGVTILARGVMIFMLIPLINPFLKEGPINWRYQLVSFWGGLRGAVALALCLSLAVDFPGRGLIIAMTLGVAAGTILLGGSTIAPLLHWLGLDRPQDMNRMEETQALFLAKQGASQRLSELKTMQIFSEAVLDDVEKVYTAQLEQASLNVEGVWTEFLAQKDLNRQIIWLQALHLESWQYQRFYDMGVLSESNFQRLNLSVNIRQDDIQAYRIPPTLPSFASLEGPLEKGWIGFLRRWFPLSSRWQQSQELFIQSHYEFDMVVAVAGYRTALKLGDQLQRLPVGIHRELFDDCIRWYGDMTQGAVGSLKTQEEQALDLVWVTQRQVAMRSALANAKRILEELANEGFIPWETKEKVSLELESG